MNGGLCHSFGVLGFLFFSHHNSPSLDSMKHLFAVRLPAGVVHVVEKSDGAKWVLEDLLVRGVGRRHDASIGERRRWRIAEYSFRRSFDRLILLRDGYGTGLITC
jgi:hypothetical protein